MTRAIIVGSGESTRHWEQLTEGKHYDYWAVLNGAVLAGTPCTHYFAMDKQCVGYEWFEEGCTKATDTIITNGHNEIYAKHLFPRARVQAFYVMPGFPSEIVGLPDINPHTSGLIILSATVATAALSYMGYLPDVTTVDVIGCECRLAEREINKFYYHFYDTEPMPRSAVDLQVKSLPRHAGVRNLMRDRIKRDRPGIEINYLW